MRYDRLQPKLTFLPVLNGIYLYLIICLICRLIVMNSKTSQYNIRIGQKTGMSKIGKNVTNRPIQIALKQFNLQQARILTCLT